MLSRPIGSHDPEPDVRVSEIDTSERVGGRPTRWRRDLAVAAALNALVLAFLLPALTLRAPVSYCDSPVESVPRAFAIARIVQHGGLPLWDFNTFAGARPFYVTNESAIFYPLMYPFYLLANLDDVSQAMVVLVLLPYVLHLLWAATGGYLFGRIGLRLHPAGAFVLGLLYSLSPEMAVQIITPDVAYLFSYLPWIMLAVTRFMQTGLVRWWLAGTVFLALMCSVGTMNFVLRVYFVTAVAIGMLWLFDVRARWKTVLPTAGEREAGVASSARSRAHQLRLPILLGAVAMMVLSLGMNGFALAGVLEGISWMQGLGKLTYQAAADMLSESSMPPPYLLTLFSPNFFGVLDNQHGWGIALSEGVTNLSALGGGVSVMVALAVALLAWLPRGPAGQQYEVQRRWTWIAGLMFAGALFTMMGRYTPVFGWLCAVLPWFFRIPHAVYYRFAESWSLAVLAAVGVSVMMSLPAAERRVGRWWVVALCVAIGVVGAAMVLLSPAAYSEDSDPGFTHLSDYSEWGWFLSGPVLAFCVGSGALLAAFTLLPLHLRGWILALVVVLETVEAAVPAFYYALLFEQTRPPPALSVLMQDRRVHSLADHPHYQLAQRLRETTQGASVRFVGYNSRVDNQAWAVDARALFGYSSKPLSPRFQDVVKRFTDGMPYDLMLLNAEGESGPVAGVEDLGGAMFLRNMNVGYLAGNLRAPPTWMSQTEDLTLYELPAPLPYVYTQDRVVTLADDDQLERLYAADLRRAVYAPPGASPGVALHDGGGEGELTAAEASRFAQLQETNRVAHVDQSVPNHLTIEVDIGRAAMLVVAECWHAGWRALVDGREQSIFRVNYLQQGIWLGPGQHRIEMRFFPANLRMGMWVSAGSTLIVLMVALCGFLRRRSTRDDVSGGCVEVAVAAPKMLAEP